MTRINGEMIAQLCADVHADNVAAGWWSDLSTGKRIDRNVGELLMLIVSEICEGAEGLSGNLMDDKLPHRKMIEVELADFAIRLFDLGGGLDLATGISEQFDNICAGDAVTEAFGYYGSQGILLRMIRFVSAAMEHHRKGRTAEMCRPLAMALHGAVLLGSTFDLHIMDAVAEKRAFNAIREDHKKEVRQLAGGKSY